MLSDFADSDESESAIPPRYPSLYFLRSPLAHSRKISSSRMGIGSTLGSSAAVLLRKSLTR